jgi:hypothetical protein
MTVQQLGRAAIKMMREDEDEYETATEGQASKGVSVNQLSHLANPPSRFLSAKASVVPAQARPGQQASYREPATGAAMDLFDRSTSSEINRLKNHVVFPRSQPEKTVTLPEIVASSQRAQKRYLKLLKASLPPHDIESLAKLLPQGGAPLYRKIAELRRGLDPEQARERPDGQQARANVAAHERCEQRPAVTVPANGHHVQYRHRVVVDQRRAQRRDNPDGPDLA